MTEDRSTAGRVVRAMVFVGAVLFAAGLLLAVGLWSGLIRLQLFRPSL